MAWVPQVDPSRIHEFLEALSAAGRPPRLYGPNFEMADVTDTRRMLYPVVDVEPTSNDHHIGLGMDVGLFPSRKAAFEQARDEQRVIATEPAGLLASFDTPGYVLFSPVYNERGFVGCVMFVFPVDQLLKGFVHGKTIPLNFRVYDATDPGQLTYLAQVSRHGEIETTNSSNQPDDAEAVRQPLDFAGRKLVALFEPGPGLRQAGMQRALVVGLLGLALTGVILWGMNYFIRSSLRLAREIAAANSAKLSLELVNRELGHRVGNLLAVAQALVWLTYEASLSTGEFRDAIIDRLHALHQSVGLINREDWKGVWLRELLKAEFAPIVDRISLSGHDILLTSRAAQSLSLLFYELMTNSSKYGALSKHEGTVTAEWEIKDSGSGPLFCFRWQEHGQGIIEPPTRQGFGTKLLTRLVPSDLSGRATLNFEPGGFRYELEASVERVVERDGNAAMKAQASVAYAPTTGI
jgi:two-component sensor histidine kinase